MSLLQNAVVFFSVILICLSFCSNSFATPAAIAEAFKLNDNSYVMIILLQPERETKNDGGTPKTRFKRQGGGAGKFADSAKMGQTKLMQMYMQMFKNIVAGKNIGGSHPMHPDAVKPTVKLFKQKIITFFFPEVGEEKV